MQPLQPTAQQEQPVQPTAQQCTRHAASTGPLTWEKMSTRLPRDCSLGSSLSSSTILPVHKGREGTGVEGEGAGRGGRAGWARVNGAMGP